MRLDSVIKRLLAALDRNDPGRYANRLLTGMSWSSLGSLSGQGLAFVSGVLLARILEPKLFGLYSLTGGVVQFFISIATLGLTIGASREIASARVNRPMRLRAISQATTRLCLVFASLVAGAVFTFRAEVGSIATTDPAIVNCIILTLPTLVFASVFACQLGLLSGLEEFKSIALLNLFRGLLGIVLLPTSSMVAGVEGALAGTIVTTVLSTLVAHIVVRRALPNHGTQAAERFDFGEVKTLLKFGIPVVSSSMLMTPIVWYCSAELSRTAGLAELGIFNSALQWYNLAMFFSGASATVVMPLLANTIASADRRGFDRMLRLNTLISVLPAAAVCLIAYPLAPYIVNIYGSSYSQGAGTLRLVLLYAALSSLSNTIGHAIWSLKAVKLAVGLSASRGACLIGFSFLMRDNGAAGLATAYCLMSGVQAITHFFALRYLIDGKELTPHDRQV